jgi:hypothetical protein
MHSILHHTAAGDSPALRVGKHTQDLSRQHSVSSKRKIVHVAFHRKDTANVMIGTSRTSSDVMHQRYAEVRLEHQVYCVAPGPDEQDRSQFARQPAAMPV